MNRIDVSAVFSRPALDSGGGSSAPAVVTWADLECPPATLDVPVPLQAPFVAPIRYVIGHCNQPGFSLDGDARVTIADKVPASALLEILVLHDASPAIQSKVVDALSARGVDIVVDPAIEAAYSGTPVQIGPRVGGKSLDVHADSGGCNGAGLQLWDFFRTENQLWRLTVTEDGYFVIRSLLSDRCLDAELPSVHDNGCRVQLWDYGSTPNQQWRLHPVDSDAGVYVLLNRAGNKCLDAFDSQVEENGCGIQLWDYNGTPNQEWVIRPA